MAIRLADVSKSYRLYGNPSDRLLDQLNLRRFMFWRGNDTDYQLFNALKDVNLTIGAGERVGIIGRNGAGKTTLLKLITQNFEPTVGRVEVNGSVQALLQLGIGFHPEFSGYENIKSALNYNGLVGEELQAALDDVIDFVELGDFLHQPMKTYSMGMGARVQFAAATAIRPDILIVDEVLGAGDAYFSAKSAHRMERLTSAGCTLLLVSHSTAQVLQFCQRCVFMHEGKVREDGPALEVVKHYEEYIQEYTQRERRRNEQAVAGMKLPQAEPAAGEGAAPPQDVTTPAWQADQLATLLMEQPAVESGVAKQRISRWAAETGLKVKRVEVRDEHGLVSHLLQAGRPCSIEIEIIAEHDGDFSARLVVLIMSLSGVGVVRHLSDEMHFSLKQGETSQVNMNYDALLLANGDFVFSVGLFKHYDPDGNSSAVRYDLLSRSFNLKVMPVERTESGLVNLPSRWVQERKQ
ncbi:ABC transporter ATP-binding protein [Bosea sp. TWI1241]|uniref:ABC transporter ATP-binding protein n=1 Tax=Bosea sp. TWI1241 TaxID=3148904 RepID=UPI003209BD4F